ncbi:MAG: LacI family DNA-binding transcriptional regulator [Streptosporangiales bacterium]
MNRHEETHAAMVTMGDVARQAGVSVTTVSHVVNSTRRVSAAAERAVRDAIAATGYVPNSIARSLVTASTRSIGLVISTVSNPYFSELVSAIESTVMEAGYTLLLADPHDEPERERQVVDALRARRVDGLLLATSEDESGLRRYVDHPGGESLPIVLIDRLASTNFDQVGVDNEQPMAGLVRHLAELGHGRIGMVTGLDGLTTTVERVKGYRRGLSDGGLPYASALVASGASDVEPAHQAVHHLLDLPDPPTALVIGNNHMMVGVLRALHERRLRVPDDVALVGFDDTEWADLLPAPLTAIAQPCQEIGQTAVRLLLSRLDDGTLPPRTIRFDPVVVHRSSCGCSVSERSDYLSPRGGTSPAEEP